MPQGTFHANSPRIILIKLIHRIRCDMYADMRIELMNRIRVNILALDALVLGLDEISLFLVLVGIKCGMIIAVQVYDMKRDVSGIVICLVILHLLEGTIHGCESAMNVSDGRSDGGFAS